MNSEWNGILAAFAVLASVITLDAQIAASEPESGLDLVEIFDQPLNPLGNDFNVLIRSDPGHLAADDFKFPVDTGIVGASFYTVVPGFPPDPTNPGSEFYLYLFDDDGSGNFPQDPPILVFGPHNPGDGVLNVELADAGLGDPAVYLVVRFNFGAEFFTTTADHKYWIAFSGTPPQNASKFGVVAVPDWDPILSPLVQLGSAGWQVYEFPPPHPPHGNIAMTLYGFQPRGGTTVLTLSGASTGCTLRITPTTFQPVACGSMPCDFEPLFGSVCHAQVTLPPFVPADLLAMAVANEINAGAYCNELISATSFGPRVVFNTTLGQKPNLCVSVNDQPAGILGASPQCVINQCGLSMRVGPSFVQPPIAPGQDRFRTSPTDCALDPTDDGGTWIELSVPGSMFDQPGTENPALDIEQRVRLAGIPADFAADDSAITVERLESLTFTGCNGDFSRIGGPAGVFSPDGVADATDLAHFNSDCFGQTENQQTHQFPTPDCARFDYNGDDSINNVDRQILQCLIAAGNSPECCPDNPGFPQWSAAPTLLSQTEMRLRACDPLLVQRQAASCPEAWSVDLYMSEEQSLVTAELGTCEPGDLQGPNGNDVIATAQDIGHVADSQSRRIGGRVGHSNLCDIAPFYPGDHDADMYRFSVPNRCDVDIAIRAFDYAIECAPSSPRARASVWLYFPSGDRIAHDDPEGQRDPAIRRRLDAGAYYVLVATGGQTTQPFPNGRPGSPFCSIASASEIDGGATDPNGYYDLNIAVLPSSQMTVTRDSAGHGRFESRLLVQPVIALQQVADSAHTLLLDSAALGLDATVLRGSGPWTSHVLPGVPVIPGDPNFIPGLQPAGNTQAITPIQFVDAEGLTTSLRVEPPRAVSCTGDPNLPGHVNAPADRGCGTWRMTDGDTIVTGDADACLDHEVCGLGYLFAPNQCHTNGVRHTGGSTAYDAEQWDDVHAPWHFFHFLDAGGAPQDQLTGLFQQLPVPMTIQPDELDALLIDIPADWTVDAVFGGIAATDGDDVGGVIRRTCNNGVVAELNASDALDESFTVRGVMWNTGAATFLTGDPGDALPQIVHAQGLPGQTRPFSGYLDPRRESNNGVALNQGLRSTRVQFNHPVVTCGELGILPSSYTISETGGAAPPNITSVAYADESRTFVEVTWDRPLTLQEWTTVRAVNVCGPFGQVPDMGNLGPVDEPDRVDLGFLPADIDQNGWVNPLDLLRYRQYVNSLALPIQGTLADFLDIDRSLGITPGDLLAFKRLINGISPATQPWSGKRMNNPRP